MEPYRPDRVVRFLSGLTTFLYVVAWVVAVLLLVAIPVGRWALPHNADVYIGVPVTLNHTQITLPAVREQWGTLSVENVKATASLRISAAPIALVVLVWAALAGLLALALLFLRELRRLFGRLREGVPFDRTNAQRLRRMGVLLIGAALWAGLAEFWMAVSIGRLLEGGRDALGTGIDLNLPVVLVGLVLIALGEIFRRGAALEDEQSLVV